MTTIVGVQNADGCVIASDSRVAEGGKVYTHPEMVKAKERAVTLSVVLVITVLYKLYCTGGNHHL